MQIIVKRKFVKTAPRKIRQAVDLIRKLDIESAKNQLKFVATGASQPVYELLKSGISAAKDKDIDTDNLKIAKIYCDEGSALKRRMIRSRGRATTFMKKSSHITLILEEKINKDNKQNKKIKDVNGSKS